MINHHVVGGLEGTRCGGGLGIDVGFVICGGTWWRWCCGCRWWRLGCVVWLRWVARWRRCWWQLVRRVVSLATTMGGIIIAISFSGCWICCCRWWFIIPPWWGVMVRRHADVTESLQRKQQYYQYSLCSDWWCSSIILPICLFVFCFVVLVDFIFIVLDLIIMGSGVVDSIRLDQEMSQCWKSRIVEMGRGVYFVRWF